MMKVADALAMIANRKGIWISSRDVLIDLLDHIEDDDRALEILHEEYRATRSHSRNFPAGSLHRQRWEETAGLLRDAISAVEGPNWDGLDALRKF
jgi:hypothetical protein